MSSVRNLLVIAITAVAATTLTAKTSEAGGYYSYGYSSGYSQRSSCTPRYYYKTVTTYEAVRKLCTTYQTKYHCGRPYQVRHTYYKTVTVPVTKRVRVAY